MVDLSLFKARICESWDYLVDVDNARDDKAATVSGIMASAVFTRPVIAFDEAYGEFIERIGQDADTYDSWLLFVINLASDLMEIDAMVGELDKLIDKMKTQLEGMNSVTFNVKDEGLPFAIGLALRLYVPYSGLAGVNNES